MLEEEFLKLKNNYEETGLYRDNTSFDFVNIELAREPANFFDIHSRYIFADPNEDRFEYDEFWDIQEKRCIDGITIPGALKHDGTIEEIHIEGEHYDYLNFSQIKTVKLPKGSNSSGTGGEAVVRDITIAASKKEQCPDFFDGDYYFYKAKALARLLGLNLCVGKRRRAGYTYKLAKNAEHRLTKHQNTITNLCAYDWAYLIGNNRLMTFLEKNIRFTNQYTDFGKDIIGNKKELTSAFELVDGTLVGFKSSVKAMSLGSNPGLVRGLEGDFVLEEAGVFPNLKEVIAALLASLKEGLFSVGMYTLFGTGGGEESNFEAFEEVFFNPKKFDCLAFDNIYDDEAEGTACSFFVPYHWNMLGYYDENGNSDKETVTAIRDAKIKELKATGDSKKVVEYEMEWPAKPSEAFARSSSNLMPTKDLERVEKRILNDPSFTANKYTGTVEYNKEGKLYFDRHTDHPEIVNFPLQEGDDIEGIICMWEHPYRNREGKIPDKLYSIWHDSFALDKDPEYIKLTDSLGVSLLYERPNNFTPTKGNCIIGCYIGRPKSTEIYNNNLIKWCEWVNATILIENDRETVKAYCKSKRKLHLLQREPDLAWNPEDNKKYGRGYGITMTEPRKDAATLYIVDWLTTVIGKTSDGRVIMVVDTIKSLRIIRELKKLRKKGNFDCFSALRVGMYDMREFLHNEKIVKESKNSVNNYLNRISRTYRKGR